MMQVENDENYEFLLGYLSLFAHPLPQKDVIATCKHYKLQ